MTDANTFVEIVAQRIAEELRRRAPEFTKHRLGAVALDTHPWHKGTMLSVLIETDEHRKWDIGAWEYQEFAEVDPHPVLLRGYEDLQDPDGEGSRYAPFFRQAAKALCHPTVEAALQFYTRDPDFELFVGDPDDPNDVNYCEEYVGVDLTRRKPKTEVVNNLDEATKDPASVTVLKYWYREGLTGLDEQRIAALSNLEVVDLTSCRLTALPACLVGLSKLKELHLDFNQITNLSGLEELRELRLLSLRSNGALTAEMLATISSRTSLRQLRIAHCGLSEVPAAFRTLEALEELYIFGNALPGVPDWLPALPNLKRLGLVDAAPELAKARLRATYPHLEVW